MSDSYLTYHPNGDAQSFVGPDAVAMYRAAVLASALRLYGKSGLLPTRGVSARSMLDQASKITGKTYKRGDALKAADDVSVWVKEMKAALPVEERAP